MAESPTRDFRAARWTAEALPSGNSAWEVQLLPPPSGYRAAFAELVFSVDGLRLHASTPTRLLGP